MPQAVINQLDITSLDGAVKALFAALPNPGTNPIGESARSILVNRTKGAVPGRATTPYIGVQGDRFIDIFFPHYALMAYQENITPATGLDESFFNNLCITVLCEAMYNLTSNLRPQILIDKARNDINGFMGRIINSGKGWYAFLLERIASDVSAAFQAIPPDQRPQALAIYRGALADSAWITAKIAQYQSGNWPNADWEMYHHYAKLTLLGDSDPSIDNLIQQLIAKSLPVPSPVTPGNWKTYFRWFGLHISWQDVRGDAANGILKEECYAFPGSVWPSCMKESNSFEFTANSQPGNKYRQVPSSCCFKAGTMVLMADRSLKPIEQIQTGELVMTPAGPKTVALISTPLRAKRTLYSFSAIDFQFADTHPFITFESLTEQSAPTFACVDPLRLIDSVPTLSPFGVIPLSCDLPPHLCQYSVDGEKSISVPPMSEHSSDSEAELLYDLILELEESGICEYYAGDLSTQVRVSSEIPRYAQNPEASYALMLMLNACYESILDTLEPVPDDIFLDAVTVGLGCINTALLPNILRNLPAEKLENESTEENLLEQLHIMIGQMFTLFSTPQKINESIAEFNNNPNTRFGNFYNTLAAIFGMQFIAALDMGWRDMTYIEPRSATMLAVSVYSIELDGTFHLPAQESLQLSIELSYEQAVFSTILTPFASGETSLYCHTFDQCAYFDMWRPGSPRQNTFSPLWSLSFQLFQAQSHEPVGGKGTIALPLEMKAGLQKETVLINDETGRLVGQITFDTRPINDLIFQSEQEARKNWTPQKKQAMAKILGESAGQYTSERFPAAAKLFGQIALVNPQSVFPPVPPPAMH